MEMIFQFMQRVPEVWYDAGVLIPALLTGFFYAMRPFLSFLGVSSLIAVFTHAMVVYLYTLKKTTGHTLIETMSSNFFERFAAFMIVALVIYVITKMIRLLIGLR